MNFGATSKNASGMTSIEIRGKALQAVEERSKATTRGTRMKGKVGIITGVGPASGIGVSPYSLIPSSPVRQLQTWTKLTSRRQLPRYTPANPPRTCTCSTTTHPTSQP